MQQGMTSGSIDMSVAGNTELAFVAKGVPEICIAVTAGPPADMALIVRADNDIAKPADLKGKTIGVTSETSLTSWLALAFSQRQGWGNDGVKRAYLGPISASVSALLVKNVDAFVGSYEGGMVLEAQGRGRPLIDFGDIGLFITHLMTASDAMVRDHPDQVKRFAAAWFETVKWMESHKQETLRLIGPPTGLSLELASKVYDNEMPAVSKDGRFDPKAVAATMDSFVALGLLTSVPKDKALYTEKFLP
jgi:ABC-type nitrate/sulfonate/bicarbonate transport system substrate-binding protein